jgi:hypothetical protein
MSQTSNDGNSGISVIPGFLVGAALAYAVVLGLYVAHFHAQPVSDDPADWGQFGDYFGGVLNPFVALLTFLAVLVTLAQNARLVRSAHEQAEAARAAQAFDVSAKQVDVAVTGMKRALDLVDGTNDRTTWIQGARILAASVRIAEAITERIHRDMLEILLFDLRNRAATILGCDNAQHVAAFFYGVPLDAQGNVTVADLTEAARLSSVARQNAPGRIGDIQHLEERTLFVFWKFAQYPDNFTDPIDQGDFRDLVREDSIRLTLYPGLREYLRHRTQFRSINGQLFPRPQP